MHRNPIVVCDANVLYGQWLRDLVMQLGSAALIQPRWSERIEQEWVSNLLGHRPDLDPARVQRTVKLMNLVLPSAKVSTSAKLPDLTLPDPDDVHVLETAVAADAAYLITFNLADFPASACESLKVDLLHPDTFMVRLHEHAPAGVTQTLLTMQRQKVRPPVSWPDLALALERAGLPKFSRLLLANPPPVEEGVTCTD